MIDDRFETEDMEEEDGEETVDLTMHPVDYQDFKGSVDITDPCYKRDVWCRMNDVKIAEGRYLCAVWTNDSPEDRFDEGRILQIGIYHEGRLPDRGTMEKIGEIGVDAGLAGFFHDKPDFTDEEWCAFCDRVGNERVVLENDSFFSSSGYGDGCYPVYAAKDEAGRTVALEICFL